MLSFKRGCLLAGLAVVTLALSGCGALGGSGPSTAKVARSKSASVGQADIRIVNVTDEVARHLLTAYRAPLFSNVLGEGAPPKTVIGQGDVLQVTIWETPPAVLFGTMGGQGVAPPGGSVSIGGSSDMPTQMVDDRGLISLPYVGALQAANKTPRELEAEIKARLKGIANNPFVTVSIARNANANVTVVGEISTSGRVPLTPRGERLLDVIASAGGVRQPVNKMTIQITRGSTVVALPMDDVIRDPLQNIRLRADDVVTAIYQPYSFTSLGASGVSAEINFEATGVTLAQALGRVGGLQDSRADTKGVFVFRWEDPAVLDPATLQGIRTAPDGRVPVIYRVNLSDPTSFFVAQSFPIRNKDILFVSNAPGADLQKFISVLSSTVFSVIGFTNGIIGQ
ncbi:MAG: polysaccharide export protein [Sphingobium sp.]|nr:polysaccharide export protein [Sphingobium sp.]